MNQARFPGDEEGLQLESAQILEILMSQIRTHCQRIERTQIGKTDDGQLLFPLDFEEPATAFIEAGLQVTRLGPYAGFLYSLLRDQALAVQRSVSYTSLRYWINFEMFFNSFSATTRSVVRVFRLKWFLGTCWTRAPQKTKARIGVAESPLVLWLLFMPVCFSRNNIYSEHSNRLLSYLARVSTVRK